jgi:CDP-paratose 2-epimerase
MATILVTGSAGLIGSESVRYFADRGFHVAGIDNDMRAQFFGPEASTVWNREILKEKYGRRYDHFDADIRDCQAVDKIFQEYSADLKLIIHTAGQPSHDWAANAPHVDFSVNANGTLALLEATRKYAPEAVFIFTSTNKVYGDHPNRLAFRELEARWEVEPDSRYQKGIDESMSIDACQHSLFGASKVAADVLVQEYGRYFGMKTVTFRGGCLTGPLHSGTQLHGFLAYLMKCTITTRPYTVFGYKGKQVRDNIHSHDLVSAFYEFFLKPRCGEIYNIGGSRHSNCSMREAIAQCQEISGKKLSWTYCDKPRSGDHVWYISNVRKFQSHYPTWSYKYDMRSILEEIYRFQVERLQAVG